jgi:hypothetical protein
MKLKLSNSEKIVEIDAKDKSIQKYDWRISSIGYVRATINKKRWFLHRYLLNPQGKEQVDHIDGDTLNNKRSNLRICSQRENCINARPMKTKIYSKFKRVTYCRTEKRRKRWVAACEVNRKRITIGRFYTEDEAKLAYNKKAKELFGVFARLN